MKTLNRCAFAAGFLALLVASGHANISLQTVTIGTPGNEADTTGYGSVSYAYAIGTYEVTLNQYAVFLNAVAATDTYGLYNPNLAIDPTIAGINQSGSNGSYIYAVIGDGQRPMSTVSWLDAARFTNWLSNGQPAGLQTAATTESGAYALNGDTTIGLETKNAGAQYWIPSENEWYKAAYYDPNKGGPGVGGYWLYPTKSNTQPGNVVGSSPNQANYNNNGVYSVTQGGGSGTNDLSNVGAFSSSASAYGTYDQGGNVFEWNDAVTGVNNGSRGMRGGSWNDGETFLRSSDHNSSGPLTEYGTIGFRIATVPEPACYGMLGFGALLFGTRRRRGT